MKDDERVMTCIGAVFYTLVITVLSIIWNGYVLSVLWSWFIVPLGVVSITIAWAIGLSVVIGLFKATVSNTSETSNNSADKSWTDILISTSIRAFVPGLVSLGLGYVVHLFM